MSLLPAIVARRRIEKRIDSPWLRLLVFTLIIRVFAAPLFDDPPANVAAGFDEHLFIAHEAAARVTILRWFELPLWNPYYCGGVLGIANPQDVTLSPDFLLRLVFGVVVGRKLTLILFLLLGMEGTFRLARRHGSSLVGALLAAVAFSTFEWFRNAASWGWVNMYSFQLLPFAVLFAEQSFSERRRTVYVAGILAWMIACGGTYTVPFTLLVFFALMLFEMGARTWRAEKVRAVFAPPLQLAIAGLLGVLLAAGRVVPLLRTVVGNPRVVEAHPVIPLVRAVNLLGMPRAGMYLGEAIIALAVLGIFARDGKVTRLLLFAAAFFPLSLGEIHPMAPFSLLRQLPVYSQLRAPDRYHIVVALFLALAAGRSLALVGDIVFTLAARLLRRLVALAHSRRPVGTSAVRTMRLVLAVGMLIASGATAWSAEAPALASNALDAHLFSFDPPIRTNREFHQARGNRWDAHVFPDGDRGSLQCFEETKFTQSAELRGDLESEIYPQDPRDGTATLLSFSPHHLRLRTELVREGTVLVNQNYSPQWAARGGAVRNESGLLAVRVPEGVQLVDLTYEDPIARASLFVSFLALVAVISALFPRQARSTFDKLRRLFTRTHAEKVTRPNDIA